MNAVLDISSVIWDKTQFEKDASCYYQLAEEVLLFMNAFERIDSKLLMRQELLDEMIISFPFDLAKNSPHFKEFKTVAYKFLSKIFDTIGYEVNDSPEFRTIPNIFHSHFSKTATIEFRYLVYEMHTTANQIVFCTFSAVWADGDLETKCNAKSKVHDTIVHTSDDSNNIESYINRFKKKFEHNSKHDRIKGWRFENGEEVSPLSCFDGIDTSKPQKLLETSQQEPNGKKLYNYDDENGTYVCFHPHEENKFHGFDVKLAEVPVVIREIFHK